MENSGLVWSFFKLVKSIADDGLMTYGLTIVVELGWELVCALIMVTGNQVLHCINLCSSAFYISHVELWFSQQPHGARLTRPHGGDCADWVIRCL